MDFSTSLIFLYSIPFSISYYIRLAIINAAHLGKRQLRIPVINTVRPSEIGWKGLVFQQLCGSKCRKNRTIFISYKKTHATRVIAIFYKNRKLLSRIQYPFGCQLLVRILLMLIKIRSSKFGMNVDIRMEVDGWQVMKCYWNPPNESFPVLTVPVGFSSVPGSFIKFFKDTKEPLFRMWGELVMKKMDRINHSI